MREAIHPALIAIEGLDAAGKNTQSKLLLDRLEGIGNVVSFYSFPRYETPLGVQINRLLRGELDVRGTRPSSERPLPGRRILPDDIGWSSDEAWTIVLQCMMNSDKYDADVSIKADLRAGRVVVCDRWSASAIAYGLADGLPLEWLQRTRASMTQADLTIYLNVTEQEALRRRPKLRDRYEKDRVKQRAVAENYQAMLYADSTWVLVDGNSDVGDLVDRIAVVHERIWRVVQGRFGTSPSDDSV